MMMTNRTSQLHYPQLPSDNKVADGRAKSLRPLSPQKRRRRRRRQQIDLNLARPALVSHRLPDLHIHPHPAPLDPLPNLPIPLPLHRPHPRLRPHPDPPPHRPGLVRDMAHSSSRHMERRPNIRQEHPHHLPADHFRRGQRHRRRHDERGGEVLRNVPYAHGRCFGFPDHRRLGCEFVYSTDGQALGCYCDL
jgi:hypothetical protein